MLQKILTNKEFKEIYDHCRSCKGSYAIKDFIGDIFKEFENSNTNLSLVLMEFIESQYHDLQGRQDLANNKYLSFKEEQSEREELKDIKEPAIEYLYSYLIYLTENNQDYLQSKVDTKEGVFKTHLEVKEIEKILNNLEEKGYCKYSSFAAIKWIFFEDKNETNHEKILWVDSAKNKETNGQTLLFFLDQIITGFDLTDRGSTKRSIIKRFSKSNGEEFQDSSFKSVIQRYNKDKNKKDRELSAAFKKLKACMQ